MTKIQLETTQPAQPVAKQEPKRLNGMQSLLLALLGSLTTDQDFMMVQVSTFGVLADESKKYQKEGQGLKYRDMPQNPTDTEIKNNQSYNQNISNQKDILSKKSQAVYQQAEIVSGRANEDVGSIGQLGSTISGLLGTTSDVNKAEINIINIRR